MTTQRPFFGNFLAAFRAHSAMQKGTASTQPSAVSTSAQPSRTYTTTSTANASSSATQTSNARSTNKTSQTASPSAAATAASTAGQFQPTRQHSTSPYSRSPASPASPGFTNRTSSKRRGSDSSTEGFRDVLGDKKWYVGGQTAAGEDRFYKLGVVKRVRSIDRLSLDRMSL